jgi:hypothetical protein
MRITPIICHDTPHMHTRQSPNHPSFHQAPHVLLTGESDDEMDGFGVRANVRMHVALTLVFVAPSWGTPDDCGIDEVQALTFFNAKGFAIPSVTDNGKAGEFAAV